MTDEQPKWGGTKDEPGAKWSESRWAPDPGPTPDEKSDTEKEDGRAA